MKKLENTLENKAKFFGLYWGQRVVYYNNYGGLRNISQEHFNKESHLELTPLSQITDEDITYLSKICICKEPIEVIIKVNKYGDKEAINISEHSTWTIGISGEDIYFKCGDFDAHIDSTGILKCYDYLRSKGYALPYMGLSVDDLIEYGWVKLKEDKC